MAATSLARRTDPASSHLAGRKAARRFAATHNERILDAIREHPGSCAPEIAKLCGWGDDNTPVSRRMKALVNAGKVLEGPPKRYTGGRHDGYFTTYRVKARLGEQEALGI